MSIKWCHQGHTPKSTDQQICQAEVQGLCCCPDSDLSPDSASMAFVHMALCLSEITSLKAEGGAAADSWQQGKQQKALKENSKETFKLPLI